MLSRYQGESVPVTGAVCGIFGLVRRYFTRKSIGLTGKALASFGPTIRVASIMQYSQSMDDIAPHYIK
jgi:hypothetical protein